MGMALQMSKEDDRTYNSLEGALDYIKKKLENGAQDITVFIWDIDSKDVYWMEQGIYDYVTEWNKGKALDDQYVTTNGYWYRGIIGCLGVQCCEVSIRKWKDTVGVCALFTGWNADVLDRSMKE